MSEMRAIALDLIGQGLHVFPLQRGKKETLRNCDHCPQNARCRDKDTPCPCWPVEPCHGFRAATNDPSVAHRWWTRWPRANVGISPWPTRHFVLDLDVKAVDVPAVLLPATLNLGDVRARSGVDLFGQVMRRLGGGDRLDTRITRTPTGGLHVWFTAPPGVTIRSSKGEAHPHGRVTGLGWQIDVRAQGGYVAAPGSVTQHGTYRVIRDCWPPLPVPDWLGWWLHQATTPTSDRGQDRPPCAATSPRAARIAGAGRSRAERIALGALASECRQIEQLRDGRKAALNKAAYKLGGYVEAGYLDEQDVITDLVQAGRAAGATRIETNVRSGLAAGRTRARHLNGAA